MTNYKKENIAQGFMFAGIGLMLIGYFVMCLEMALSSCPVIGLVLMITGAVLFVISLTYMAFKGWL